MNIPIISKLIRSTVFVMFSFGVCSTVFAAGVDVYVDDSSAPYYEFTINNNNWDYVDTFELSFSLERIDVSSAFFPTYGGYINWDDTILSVISENGIGDIIDFHVLWEASDDEFVISRGESSVVPFFVNIDDWLLISPMSWTVSGQEACYNVGIGCFPVPGELSGVISGVSLVDDDLPGLGTDGSSAPVPEPATMLLFGTGLVGLAGSRLRRKKG